MTSSSEEEEEETQKNNNHKWQTVRSTKRKKSPINQKSPQMT
jgi:hypothetical protein